MQAISKLVSQTGNRKMTMTILEDTKQLQGHRYGQNDDSKVSNVAIGTIHPLGWIWHETQQNNANVH